MTVDDFTGQNELTPAGPSTARRLYRLSSLPVNHHGDLLGPALTSLELSASATDDEEKGLAMTSLRRVSDMKLASSNITSTGTVMQRSRASTGLSVRSRRASRAEYHEDLKPAIKHRLTSNLVWMSFIILLGMSFQFGYNIGVLNQPVQLIKDFYNVTYTNRTGDMDDYMLTFLWSLTTAMYLPGGMIGAFSVGYLADRIGRKRSVLVSNVPAILGAAVSVFCVRFNMPELLMIGRFITGINCGMATQLAPLYLTEISPYNLRGMFGTANQLFITIGIFTGSVFGLGQILGTESLWPYLLLVNAGPAVVSLLFMPCLPDSPRYLAITRNRRQEAIRALRFLRMTNDVSADMEEMETECHDQASSSSSSTSSSAADKTSSELKQSRQSDEAGGGSYTMAKLLSTKELRLPLLITVVLQIAQQLSGINAIFFYSTGIYRHAGVAEAAIQFAVVGTCAVNVVMTIVAVSLMDRAGRRPLLLYPMAAMVLVLAVITVAIKYQTMWAWLSYVSVACVISYVVCFAVGLGPIPMMIGAELFRQGPRPRAMSIAGLTNWLFTAVVALSFELVQKLLSEYTFLIFFFLMIFFTVFVYRKVPETKNRTFEEIASQFQPGGDIDVEEIVADDDVFGTLSPPSDVTDFEVANDVRASVIPMTQSSNAVTKNSDENDQCWVIRL